MIQLSELQKIDDSFIQEFHLSKEDRLYECYLEHQKIGYAIIRQKGNDRIFLIVAEKYQNQGYGSAIFKMLLSFIHESVVCSVPFENVKMHRIIQKNNGIEIGRNGSSVQYMIAYHSYEK